MKLNTQGFEQGLVLTDRQAKAMGKQIAQALTIDTKSATTAFKTIAREKDLLIENFKKLKTAVNDSLKITPASAKATTDKLKEVSGGLKTVADKARDASNAMKNVKFLVGQTNKNIDSVIKKLEKLEAIANRIGTITVGVNYVNQGGAALPRGGSGVTRSGSTAREDHSKSNPITTTTSSGVTKQLGYGPAGFSPSELEKEWAKFGPRIIQRVDETFSAIEQVAKNKTVKVQQSLATLLHWDRLQQESSKKTKDINVANFQQQSAAALGYLNIATRMSESLKRQEELRIKQIQRRTAISKAATDQAIRENERASNAFGSQIRPAYNMTNTLTMAAQSLPKPPIGARIGDLAGRGLVAGLDAGDRLIQKTISSAKNLGTTFSNVKTSIGGSMAKANAALDSFDKKVHSVTKNGKSRFAEFFSASFAADLLANAFQRITTQLSNLVVETVKYAARTQELGVVLDSLAKVNNISTDTILKQEVAVKRLNITTQDTRETLARFINVGFDLNQAGPLARVAQDLAVIGGLNTSEELDKLVVGIQTLQSRNLRTAGVFLTVDEVLDKLSATSGRARDSFSTLEKQQAVLSAVLEYGTKVAGTYEAAMDTASKQMRSLDRLFYEAQNALGTGFIPVMEDVVYWMGEGLKFASKYPQVIIGFTQSILALSAAMIALKTNAIQSAVGSVGSLLTGVADIGRVATGRPTARQTTRNAEIAAQRQQLQLQEMQLRVASRQEVVEIRRIKQIQAQNRTLEQQLALQRYNARRGQITDIRQQQTDLGKQGMGDKIASGLGKAFVVGAAIVAVSELWEAAIEYARALPDLKPIDISFNQKLAAESTRVTQNQLLLQDAISGKIEDQNSLKYIDTKVSKELSDLSKNNLRLYELQNKTTLTGIDLRRKQLELLEKEKELIKEQQSEQLKLAGIEIQSALRRSERADTEFKKFGEAAAIVEKAAKEQGDKTSREDYAWTTRLYNDITTMGLGKVAGLFGQTQGDLAMSWATDVSSGGPGWLTTGIQRTDILKDYAEAGKAARQSQEELNQALGDFVKTAELQGKDPVDMINEMELQGDATRIDMIKNKVKELYEELQRVKLEKIKIALELVTPEKASTDIFKTFAQQVETQVNKTIQDLKISDPTLTGERLVQLQGRLRTETAASLLKTDEGEQIENRVKALIAQGLSSERAKGTVVDEAFIRNYTKSILQSNATVPLTRFNPLTGVEEVIENVNVAQYFTEAEKANKEFNQQLEQVAPHFDEIVNGVTEAEKKLRDFFGSDIVRSLEDFQKNKLASSAEKFRSGSFELGISPEEVKKQLAEIDRLRGTDPQAAQALVDKLNKSNDIAQKLTDARKNLEELRNPNLELKRIEAETGLVQAQQRLEHLKNPDAEVKRLEDEIRATERQIAIEEAVLKYKQEQEEVEDAIATLKRTVTLPVVNSELLAQRAILEAVQERKKAEQQLTADIAVEIVKRRNFERNPGGTVSRIAGEVFLERQRGELAARESLIKTALESDFAEGRTGIFSDNEFIKEAQRQSDKLAKIDEQGGKAVVAQNEGNELQKVGNEYLKGQIDATAVVSKGVFTVNDTITSGNADLLTVLQEISSKTGMGGDYGDYTSNSEKGKLIVETAKRLGMSPATLAGIIDFESGGNPAATNKYGYQGLIQFSPDLQRRYGVSNRTSFADQMPFIERYFKERGFKPGMSDLQAYATILGGNPFANMNKADANGTTPLSGINAQRARMNRVLAKYQLVPTSGTAVSRRQVESKDILAETEKKLAADRLKSEQQKKADELKKKQELDTYYDKIGQTYLGRALVGELEIKAVDDYIKAVKDSKDAIRRQELERELNEKNPAEARRRAFQEARQERLNFASREETGAGSEERRAQKMALMTEAFNLRFRGGVDYLKALEDFDISKWQEYVDLQRESLNLELETEFRTKKFDQYRSRTQTKLNNAQISQMYQLQDAEEELSFRREQFADKNSQYYRNIIKAEKNAKEEAKQALVERTEELKRYNKFELNSTENRLRIAQEADNARLESYRELVESIMQLDEEYGYANENLQLELLKRQKELRNEDEQSHKQTLLRQLELENEYRKKLKPFNADEFRNRGLEKITSAMKSETELMGDLFSDTFDGIADGFGGLIYKMTSRMGIFGSAVGNLLKGITNNILGGLFNTILGELSPTNADVADTLAGKDVAIPAQQAQKAAAQMLTSSLAAVDSANTLITANNGVGNSSIALANTFASIAISMVSVVEQFAVTVTNILSNIPQGGGGGGGIMSGGGGASTAIAAIQAASGSGQAGIGAATGSLTDMSVGGITGSLSTGLGNLVGSATSSAGGPGKALSGTASKLISGVLSGKKLSAIGGSLVAGLPMLGAGLGGMLGGQSGIGGILGQAGGLLGGLAGIAGIGLAGAMTGSAGLFGLGTGLFGAGGMLGTGSVLGGLFGGVGGMFGLAGTTATMLGATVVLAPLAAGLMVGAWLLGRNAKRRKNEKIRNQAMLEALPALQELLKGVKTDKIDGNEALTRADEIRKQYIEQMSKLDDKKTRRIALKDVSRLDAVIAEIKVAAKNQSIRREIDDRIVPTYSTGGVGQGLIRVSKGETLFLPHSEGTFGGHHIAAGNIPNFADGGSYTGVRIRGNFDGKDNILARVPKGTVIANPRQVSKIRQSRGFATGGVAGRSGSPTAQGTITVQPPQVTAIIVFSPEEAEKLGQQIPNSVIVGKVRQHVQKTGTTGLAGDIVNSFD